MNRQAVGNPYSPLWLLPPPNTPHYPALSMRFSTLYSVFTLLVSAVPHRFPFFRTLSIIDFGSHTSGIDISNYSPLSLLLPRFPSPPSFIAVNTPHNAARDKPEFCIAHSHPDHILVGFHCSNLTSSRSTDQANNNIHTYILYIFICLLIFYGVSIYLSKPPLLLISTGRLGSTKSPVLTHLYGIGAVFIFIFYFF